MMIGSDFSKDGTTSSDSAGHSPSGVHLYIQNDT